MQNFNTELKEKNKCFTKKNKKIFLLIPKFD